MCVKLRENHDEVPPSEQDRNIAIFQAAAALSNAAIEEFYILSVEKFLSLLSSVHCGQEKSFLLSQLII